MTIIWYNRALCDGCSDYIWSEHPSHHIECSCSKIQIIGTNITRGVSGNLVEADFEQSVKDGNFNQELTIIKWQ